MRRVIYVLVVVVFTVSAVAAPRDERGPRSNPVVKMVKKIVRSLGDGITIPVPGPKP
jgi:hypothetical protein